MKLVNETQIEAEVTTIRRFLQRGSPFGGQSGSRHSEVATMGVHCRPLSRCKCPFRVLPILRHPNAVRGQPLRLQKSPGTSAVGRRGAARNRIWRRTSQLARRWRGPRQRRRPTTWTTWRLAVTRPRAAFHQRAGLGRSESTANRARSITGIGCWGNFLATLGGKFAQATAPEANV